jgi:hypothetical protein
MPKMARSSLALPTGDPGKLAIVLWLKLAAFEAVIHTSHSSDQ